MEKKSKNQNSSLPAFIVLFALFAVIAFCFLYYIFFVTKKNAPVSLDSESRSYHIIVTGNSENELFLKQVYNGARKFGDTYNSVVELYVPSSQAEDVSYQSLFDYASYVNADCIIAYIDSSYNIISLPRRVDETPIPLITTGQYIPSLSQISFIGNSYWELGKKIGDETVSILENKGHAIIINSDNPSSNNYSSLMNSFRDILKNHEELSYSVMESIDPVDLMKTNEETPLLLICLSEEDTIKTAQTFIETNLTSNKNIGIMGFGANETCQLYLKKGVIRELISLDPEKIGETAIREFYEFRTRGYANSYIAADLKISRSIN